MSGKDRSKQRVESFVNELEQGTASLTDEEFARLERMIREGSDRAAAHVIVAPIDTAQPCNPRSSSEISFEMYVFICRDITRAGWTQSEISSNHHRLVGF